MDTLQGKEDWKVVEGFSRYEVSDTGTVRDIETLREIPQPFNNNFYCVNLIGDSGKVLCKVHRLVAIAYLENPENAHNVAHKNGDRTNNCVENLYWKSKKVKEVSERVLKTLTFNSQTYTYNEFCKLSGCDISTLSSRLVAGWSVRECFTGIKEFIGDGYEDSCCWYPTKGGYESAAIKQRAVEQQLSKEQRNTDSALKRAAAKAKIHYGVGVFVNYPIIAITGRKSLRVYSVWQGIIARCYNPLHHSYQRYGGRGVVVDARWHHFQEFAKWYSDQQQRGMGNAHASWQVDKDILFEDNLIYSPDTCCFVPGEVNTFFSGLTSNGYTEQKGLYIGSIQISGTKHQRVFRIKEDAISWYNEGKTRAAEILMWKYSGLLDDRVVAKLQYV